MKIAIQICYISISESIEFSFGMHLFNKCAAISNKIAIYMHFSYCKTTLGSKNKLKISEIRQILPLKPPKRRPWRFFLKTKKSVREVQFWLALIKEK